jgi:hypothetical protein
VAFVYYQKAIKYTYATAPVLTPPITDILSADVDPGSDMRTEYFLFKTKYNGKLCIDVGYNIEDILATWKSAVSYRDCYKNMLLTLTDFSNWLGPKAMWVDSCEFHSDEDFLMYSYNPYGRSKDSGDISMLHHRSRIRDRTAATPVLYRRPAHGHANFYRDCLPVDDKLLEGLNYFNLAYVYELISLYFQLFNLSIDDIIFPKFDYSKV